MSTVAPALVKQLASDWSNKCGLKSAKLTGIVGDAAHAARGGYHRSRQDNPDGNYSIVRPDDLTGPADMASAIDMNLSASDMRLCTGRLVSAFMNGSDPRRKYLNAFNGTLDSKTARRFDVYARKVKAASPDHLWHIHLEIRRKYVGSATAMKAILSILKGESVAQYLASVGVSHSASAGSGATTSTAPPFPGILKRNDKQSKPDAGVKAFQARMIARGWSSLGVADGFFGPKLESVVKKWQGQVGLGADGVIGAKTWPTPWTRPVGK